MTRTCVLLPILLGLSGVGCGVEVCKAHSIPAPFVGIEADLPIQMVFCKEDPEHVPEKPPPPNRVHVNFRLATPQDAWIGMVDHFEAKGWERIDQRTDKWALAVTFRHPETGHVLDFTLIDEHRAESPLKRRRVHGKITLSQAPCLQKFGANDSVCVEDTLVRCSYGMPVERVECGVDKICIGGGEFSPAACVSDLCVGTKPWNPMLDPGLCPPEPD